MSPLCLNPDEAELVASGKRAMMSIIPYETFSTSTSGVWWPTFLGLLGRIGFPLNLKGAHLLSSLFGASISTLMYSILRKFLDFKLAAKVALLIAIPWATSFAIFNSSLTKDFSSLATELLPLFMMALGSAAISHTPATRRSALFAIVMAGMSASAKYQFVPLALILAGYSMKKLKPLLHNPWRRWSLGIAAFVAPTLAAFGFAVILVDDSYAYQEPISLLLDYLRARSSSADPISLTQRVRQFTMTTWSMPPLVVALFVASRCVRKNVECGELAPKNIWNQTYFLIPFVVSVLSVLVPGVSIAHYLHLLIGGVILCFVLISPSGEDAPRPIEPEQNSVLYFAVASLAISGLANINTDLTSFTAKLAEMWKIDRAYVALQNPDDSANPKIAELCPAESTVLVWGWSPDFYSYFDWSPATRYTIQSGMISGSAEPWNRRHLDMKRQILAELTEEEPDCIVNATGPGLFPYVYTDGQKIQEQIPEIRSLLLSDYTAHSVPIQAVSTYIYAQDSLEIFVRN